MVIGAFEGDQSGGGATSDLASARVLSGQHAWDCRSGAQVSGGNPPVGDISRLPDARFASALRPLRTAVVAGFSLLFRPSGKKSCKISSVEEVARPTG
jgi:hypothetical protein